jgi:hypothetical protein
MKREEVVQCALTHKITNILIAMVGLVGMYPVIYYNLEKLTARASQPVDIFMILGFIYFSVLRIERVFYYVGIHGILKHHLDRPRNTLSWSEAMAHDFYRFLSPSRTGVSTALSGGTFLVIVGLIWLDVCSTTPCTWGLSLGYTWALIMVAAFCSITSFALDACHSELPEIDPER